MPNCIASKVVLHRSEQNAFLTSLLDKAIRTPYRKLRRRYTGSTGFLFTGWANFRYE